MADLPEDEGLRLYREAQSEALATADAADAELRPLFQETAEHIKTELKLPANQNAKRIRETIDTGFEKTVHRRRRAIAKAITESAPHGAKAARKQLRKVFGDEVTRAQVRTSKAALEEGAERIAGRVSVDNVSLSKRIRRWDKDLGAEMAQEVERGLKSKKGIEQIAEQIQKIDTVTPELPKYLRRVEELARKGSPELKKVAKQYVARAQKTLGTMVDGARKASPYSLRSPTQKFLRDIQKAGADGIDRVVKQYVEDKAAWRARVIAREESVQGMHRAYVENSKNKPGVYAFDWKLSGSHPRADICDAWAASNNCALGPGRYTADSLPHKHIGCLCYVVAVIDKAHFDRKEGDPGPVVEYADKKSPDAHAWLRRNDAAAAQILGPTRHEALKQGHNVLDAKFKPVLVRDLPGFAQAAE